MDAWERTANEEEDDKKRVGGRKQYRVAPHVKIKGKENDYSFTHTEKESHQIIVWALIEM